MELDFSFALVSSLTPRRKAVKTSPTESLKNTKPLRTKLNLPTKQLHSSHQKREEKENLLTEEQLMNKDKFLKPNENKNNTNPSNNIHSRNSDDETTSFSVNMENIAVRRNRTRGRKKFEINPLQPCDNILESGYENVGNLPNEKNSLCTPVVINNSSDVDENCHEAQTNKGKCQLDSGESPRLSTVSDSSMRSSLDIIESSCLDVKCNSFDNEIDICRNLRLFSTKKANVKVRSTRSSGLSETSLSTAYDSDSFQVTCRRGAKVILETPDTEKSSRESLNDKRKSSVLSFTSEQSKETLSFGTSNNTRRSSKKNSSTKRKSSEISGTPEENKKRCSVESSCSDLLEQVTSSVLSSTLEENNQVDKFHTVCISGNESEGERFEITTNVCNDPVLCVPTELNNKNKAGVRKKKKFRSKNDSSISDMFKLESTIKEPLQSEVKTEVSNTKFDFIASCTDKQEETGISPILKGRNTKIANSKPDLVKKNKIKEKGAVRNITKDSEDDGSKINPRRSRRRNCSPMSPKRSTFVPPSEVISKFEHINQWLKDTQEKNICSSESSSVAATVISKKDTVPIKNKYKVSLSPRIKEKKEKAKTSLEEEQKCFEELFGCKNRLSDDVDEVASRTSCRDSIEFSENVLDKLYGTVWKDTVTTQSEPKKGKKNLKNKTPLTDRKKHRTSIYEVFSSSSSEDRFEEFLENVQRGKMESPKRRSGRPGSIEFINDTDSEDNTSLVFYQNIVSSAVKDEVSNLRRGDIKSGQDSRKMNRRRLSFSSSKDDCSESGKSDTKTSSKGKSKTEVNKTKTKKSRTKKKENNYIEGKGSGDIDVFSLVTPLKIKGKKAESDLGEKVINLVTHEVPNSVGKPKTPRNRTRQKELSNSEERLKTTYLRECDFKVPKSTSKTFKTPSKTAKPDVPSSPALSFLSSLSDMTAGLPCHPDALLYKKSFKSKREELTKRLFTLYNKEVFDNQLPADMMIQWNSRMTSTSGYCYNKRIYRDNQILRSSRIVLSIKILDRADRLRDTLIHELCHAATWILNGTSDGHGPIWKSWADKANRRFPELPVIKRCHDYAISTKFTYKCMSCGYSIGRHTKSLDTDRKRCGFCYGKFQVFVTAKMSSASATSGSDSVKTTRNPTGFALFVKENYAIIKKANNVPHAQVMKLLSQKFAEVKISKQNVEEPILIG